jgi:hypothetical protein
MKFLKVHVLVRNDYGPQEHFIQFFDTFEEGLENIFKEIKDRVGDEERFLSEKGKIENLLSQGKAIWIWEWEKKGNGDYWSLRILDEKKDTAMGIPLEIDLEASVTVLD